MNPKHLLFLCASIFIFSCARKPTRPNIVFIMTDDHSYQAISAYGSEISKLAPTPNIDRLAKEGMLFQRAFVENSICTPSRACLMTGLYSHQNGQRQLFEGIDTTKVFVSELLQRAGYQTALIGKWHMSCEPKGFDTYRILNRQGQYYNPVFKTESSNGKYIQEEGYATTLITDHAIQFLKMKNSDKPFCLFVHHKAPHRNWMPDSKYLDLYENIEFPQPETFNDDYASRCSAAASQAMTIEKEMELVDDLKVMELNGNPQFQHAAFTGGLASELKRMNPSQRQAWEEAYAPKNKIFLDQKLKGEALKKWKYQRYIKDYLRCIKSVDDEVGRLLDYLETEGLMENTVVVYTSDQGFYVGEHGWFDKRFMYEESFRTPLIVRYPKIIPAGSMSNALVQNIDFAPTLLALAGAKQPEEMTGLSLVPLFTDAPSENWRSSLYYHYYDYPAFHNVRRHDGVRTNKYKLIHFYGKGGVGGGTSLMQLKEGTAERKFMLAYAASGKIGNDTDIDCYELYDLKEDPHELNNLYNEPSYDAIRSELHKMLDKYRKDLKVDEY